MKDASNTFFWIREPQHDAYWVKYVRGTSLVDLPSMSLSGNGYSSL